MTSDIESKIIGVISSEELEISEEKSQTWVLSKAGTALVIQSQLSNGEWLPIHFHSKEDALHFKQRYGVPDDYEPEYVPTSASH